MRRQFTLPLLLGAGLLVFGGAGEPASAQIGRAVKKATRRSAPRAKQPRNKSQGILPGTPRGAAPASGGANLLIERLVLMPADERSQFLRNNRRFTRLPKGQQQRIQQRLKQIDAMPAAQRDALIRRYRYFSSLPPVDQREARQDYAAWRQLPRERRTELTREARQLYRASPRRRQARLDSAAFADAYSAPERRIIELLVGVSSAEPQRRPIY